jgi:hypothetical protein
MYTDGWYVAHYSTDANDVKTLVAATFASICWITQNDKLN